MKLLHYLSFEFMLISVNSENYYCAIIGLEKLVQTQETLAHVIENYMKFEYERLEVLERLHKQFDLQTKLAKENVDIYLANPLNTYKLIKRLTVDRKQIEALISTNLSLVYYNNLPTDLEFPVEEDLTGAAIGIFRLQDVHKLDSKTLADGSNFNTFSSSSKLTAAECFDLAREAHFQNDYYHTKLWIQESYYRLKNEKIVEEPLVLEYLSLIAYKEGNPRRALTHINELLKLYPQNARGLVNKNYYESLIYGHKPYKNEVLAPPQFHECRTKFCTMCRKEFIYKEEENSKLKCEYFTGDNPFLIISPFKREEVFQNPNVYLFHEIVSDKEIEKFKELALPMMQRASVHDAKKKNVFTNIRIAKGAWLSEEYDIHHVLDQRIEDMTGLSMETSEPYQVVNYGIGGHYLVHFDNLWDNWHGMGDRLATLLFYMSDVLQGGETVFVNLNISITPRKGSVLFWYNLHSNGDADKRTLHGSCPVVAGTKWITTKWIRELGQIFHKPCSLEKPPLEFVRIPSVE